MFCTSKLSPTIIVMFEFHDRNVNSDGSMYIFFRKLIPQEVSLLDVAVYFVYHFRLYAIPVCIQYKCVKNKQLVTRNVSLRLFDKCVEMYSK